MITPSFSPTATERVLPKLALDFTTASLDSRVTFTRTTGTSNPATYVNSSGYVTSATNNQPRFDYSPTTLICNGLLIEESRANVFTYSEDATNWNGVTGGSLTGSLTSPANTSTANLFTQDTSTGEHYIRKLVTGLSANTIYSVSLFVKTNGSNFRIRVLDTDITANGYYATFNSTTGAVLNTSSVGVGTFSSTTVTAYSNGWYRFTVSGNAGLTATKYTIDIQQTLPGGGTTAFTGNGTSGIYLWGAQLEAGAFPTSYIPTTTTALTRNADVATMTGTNFSSWFNASEGTFAITVTSFTAAPSPARVSLLVKKATTGSIDIRICRPSGLTGGSVADDAGTLVANFSYGSAITANTAITGVLAYKANSFAYADRKGTPMTSTSGALPTALTSLYIGNDSGTVFQNGYIKNLYYWPQHLTNNEVQAFSN